MRLSSYPFYVWRSVLWGRDLPEQGIKRRIGTGEDTLVFSHPRIPWECSFWLITLMAEGVAGALEGEHQKYPLYSL